MKSATKKKKVGFNSIAQFIYLFILQNLTLETGDPGPCSNSTVELLPHVPSMCSIIHGMRTHPQTYFKMAAAALATESILQTGEKRKITESKTSLPKPAKEREKRKTLSPY